MYNSLSSNKMNKTMQVLTIITVISLPATIITGIFGMNFDIMPLLHNYYGFTLSMVLLILIIIIEIYLFRKNKYM
ncbi:Magnesium transport protein CorA [compost metagenome]